MVDELRSVQGVRAGKVSLFSELCVLHPPLRVKATRVAFFLFSCFWQRCPNVLQDQKVRRAFLPLFISALGWTEGSGRAPVHPERRSCRRPERDFLASPGSVWPRKTITHKEQVQCMVELRL